MSCNHAAQHWAPSPGLVPPRSRRACSPPRMPMQRVVARLRSMCQQCHIPTAKACQGGGQKWLQSRRDGHCFRPWLVQESGGLTRPCDTLHESASVLAHISLSHQYYHYSLVSSAVNSVLCDSQWPAPQLKADPRSNACACVGHWLCAAGERMRRLSLAMSTVHDTNAVSRLGINDTISPCWLSYSKHDMTLFTKPVMQ